MGPSSSACGRGGDGSEAGSARIGERRERLRSRASEQGQGPCRPVCRSTQDPDPEGAMAARSAAGGRAAAEGPSPARPQKPSGRFPASSRLRAHDESNRLARGSSSGAKGKEAVVGIAPGAVGACVDVLG